MPKTGDAGSIPNGTAERLVGGTGRIAERGRSQVAARRRQGLGGFRAVGVGTLRLFDRSQSEASAELRRRCGRTAHAVRYATNVVLLEILTTLGTRQIRRESRGGLHSSGTRTRSHAFEGCRRNERAGAAGGETRP